MTSLLPGVRLPLMRPRRDVPADVFDETLRRVWRLPKVELHLHLEGTLRPETVCEMAGRYEPESPLCHPAWMQGYWTFRDLAGFVVEFGLVLRACLRSAGDYYRVARECFEDLAAQHVVYAEVSVGPHIPGRPRYVSVEDTLAAIDQARREIEARAPLRVGIIVGLSRNHLMADDAGAEALSLQFIRDSLRMRDAGAAVIGVDLHGDEAGAPDVSPFVPAFRLAAEAGLGLRAHAGEGEGAHMVWDSLRGLEVQRIAHGVRAIEDPALVAYLARERVPLDMCPTSNVQLGAAPSLEAHPIRALHDAGVVVTVSSDDPLVFNTSITTELALLNHHLGFSFAGLGQLTAQAAAHSFLPEPARTALVTGVREAWAQARSR